MSTREQIEMAPPRAAFAATIEAAESEGSRRIRGVANTFGLMRSRRIIHPQALDAWLAEGDGRVPLLGQHGDVAGFATIGSATLRVAGGEVKFEATLIAGTALAEEAWTLVQQGALRTVSLGWVPREWRWVSDTDSDLDPHVKREMKRAGARDAYLLRVIEPAELSLVDVPDDPGAVLAAAAHEALSARVDAALAPLAQQVAGVQQALDELRGSALRRPDADALASAIAGRVMETIETHFALLEAARDAYLEGDAGQAEAGGADGADVARPGSSGAGSAGAASPSLAELIAQLRGHSHEDK